MDITWIGHSCFRLRADDLVVITDPFPLAVGLRPDNRPATVVTVSSAHPNHSNWGEVAGSPRIFDAPGEYEYSGVSVRGVMTPLPPGASPESRTVAYSIEMDRVNICHLGDISVPLTTRLVDELSPVDVLLLPTGGGSTLDLDQAIQAMQDLDPKIVIPMHHLPAATTAAAPAGGGEGQEGPAGQPAAQPAGAEPGAGDADGAGSGAGAGQPSDRPIYSLDLFLRRMGLDEVQPQPRLVVTQNNLPTDRRVVVLSPTARAA